MAEIPLRLIKVVGVYITGAMNFALPKDDPHHSCVGTDPRWDASDWEYHRVEKCLLTDTSITDTEQLDMDRAGKTTPEDYFGLKCVRCGLELTKEVYDRSIYEYSNREDKKPEPFTIGSHLYNTESGSPEVGDIYPAHWFERPVAGENAGPVYAIVLPKGWLWPTNQRASNCPHDANTPKDHRCWTITGTMPNITVRPSIMMGEGKGQIHGFITDGKWADC